jgi:ADP-heptose:LPS heptosyltransferase
VEKSFTLAFPNGDMAAIPKPELELPEAVEREAAEAVSRLFPGNSRIAVLHPGTSAFGAFKRWPADRFGQLAVRLHEGFGIPSLVTWGPGEESLAETAVAASDGKALVAPGTRSILELAGLIGCGVLFVAADSGPLHLANLLGIPCVALFGPKDPAVYRPYFQPSAVVQTGACCSPCSLRKCDDPICMTEMGVEAVYEAAARLLEEDGVGPAR